NSGPYTVVVSNSIGSVVSASARLRVLPRLVITQQPASQETVVGAQIELKIGVAGFPAYYQWRFNGTNISGATEPTLLFTNLQVPDTGNYTVVITNDVSAVVSAVARLSVLADARQSWLAGFGGSEFPTSQTVAMKLDDRGNIYVAGASFGSSGNDDYVTRK